jgi:DNA-directed RNA polymerase
LSKVFDGVNFLGSIPWQINEPVWKVVKALWAQGGGVGDMPASLDKPLPRQSQHAHAHA